MAITRREFIATGAGATVAALTGCDFLPENRFPRFLGELDPPGPWEAPGGAGIDLISHALNRLTFGPRPGDYGRVRAMGPSPEAAVAAFVEEQLNPESIDDGPAQRTIRRFEEINDAPGDMYEHKPRVLLAEMTRATLLRAVYSRRQLYEVMVHFWTDHFNIDQAKADCRWLKAADDRDVIRKHAMGKFSELVRASALSPAMLWYLDGRENVKAKPEDHPNENYARELLELHTLGVDGGYTQTDVMELARCLTGWSVYPQKLLKTAKVHFDKKKHDDGSKTLLGRTIPAGQGEKDLDLALEIICGHPSTAAHVARKLGEKFIGDNWPIAAMDYAAAAFRSSGGDIRETLRALLSSVEFLEARGDRFKRPFHFMVSTLRATAAQTNAATRAGGDGKHAPFTRHLERMGHMPFQFPTPDGYPDEAGPWMGGLLWRWNFALALAEGTVAGTKIDLKKLHGGFGGEDRLLAHLLGRAPTEPELDAARGSGAALALALASPGFQRY